MNTTPLPADQPMTFEATASTALIPASDPSHIDSEAARKLAIQRLETNNLIKNNVLLALGAGLVPSPLFDTVAVTALEVRMITKMATIYEFPVPHKLVILKVLVSLLSSVGMIYAAVKLQSLVKMAPGIGYMYHASLLSISGGAAVYAVGKLFQAHYESGGTFLTSDNAILKRTFRKHFDEGKKQVANWQRGAQSPTAA
jgi:uncharacterized protein (DUF697 family)